MDGDFFIGRAKDLEKLEAFLLRNEAPVQRPRLAHIWGNSGVGKTALADKFVSILTEESEPILYFSLGDLGDEVLDDPVFFNELISSADTNIGDIHPWLEQLKSRYYTPGGDEDEPVTIEGFWANQFKNIIDTITHETVFGPKDLCIVFSVDAIAKFQLSNRIAFCSFVNRLCELTPPELTISVLTTGIESLQQTPDVGSFWEDSIKSSFQIQLGNLSREETIQLLEANDLDSNLIVKIYNQTGGNPGKIKAILQDQDLESINFEESYARGKNMMYQFNNFQRRWIEWAAIMKFCNEETVSMITEGQEISECVNWIHKNYPTLFIREGHDYILRPSIRRAILAYVQRENPEVYEEVSQIVKRLAGVKHAIPSAQHRFLLSKLGDLNYFDLDLLKKIFDEDTYRALLNLVESKPIFFRQDLDTYRLASSIRAAIAIYNSLRKNPEREKFQYRVGALWLEKQRALNKELEKSQKNLKQSEERNRSLTQSLHKIEDEIQKLKIAEKREKSAYKPIQSNHRPKRMALLGAFILQATGIGILYVDTLIMRNTSITYLVLSAICITSGVILGVKNPQRSAQTISGSAHMSTKSSENYAQITKNLKTDLMNLQSQKDQALLAIDREKQNINNFQNLKNCSYLPESE